MPMNASPSGPEHGDRVRAICNTFRCDVFPMCLSERHVAVFLDYR